MNLMSGTYKLSVLQGKSVDYKETNEYKVELSVVIPAYNERACIAACLEELVEVIGPLERSFEIIVVDDGSTDGTYDVLREKKKDLPELVVVHFDRNHGQTAAFDAGFKASRGDVIVTLDADMQNDPADIPWLVELTEYWDVVCGYRETRHDSFVRRASSIIANWVRNRLTDEFIRDVGCSLRAMRAECVKGLKLHDGMHRFLPTLLKMEGYSVTEYPVNHRHRERGRSKYGIRNRLFRGLRDVMAVRWMKSRRLRYKIEETVK